MKIEDVTIDTVRREQLGMVNATDARRFVNAKVGELIETISSHRERLSNDDKAALRNLIARVSQTL